MSESITKEETINNELGIEAKHPKLKEFILKVDERKAEITEEICTLIAHLSRKQREYLVLLDNIYADVLIKYESLDAKLQTLVKTKISLESALKANDHSTLLNDTSAPLEAEIERIQKEQKFLPIDINIKWQTEQFDKLMSNLLRISVINGQEEVLDSLELQNESPLFVQTEIISIDALSIQKRQSKKKIKRQNLSEFEFYFPNKSEPNYLDDDDDDEFNNHATLDIHKKQGFFRSSLTRLSSRASSLTPPTKVKSPLIKTHFLKEENESLKFDLLTANENLEIYRDRLRSHLVAAGNYSEEKLLSVDDDKLLTSIFFDFLYST